MFSVRQKREIADAVQKILRDTKHPELPQGEIRFKLHVDGAEAWSWADIRNNGDVTTPDLNPHNEAQDKGEYAVPEVNTPPPVTANTLSNTELAMAIDRASNSSGDASDVQKLWKSHLEALLEIQRMRATELVVIKDHGEEQPA